MSAPLTLAKSEELLARVEEVDPAMAHTLRARLAAGRGHRRVLGIIDAVFADAARILSRR